jgi:hypothetical protein
MVGNILVSVATAAICCIAFIFVSRGSTQTQALLRLADEHDIVIDFMAWLDRKFFGGALPQKASQTAEQEVCD